VAKVKFLCVVVLEEEAKSQALSSSDYTLRLARSIRHGTKELKLVF
jgi:hypothetical protein